jgi:peptide/nickel transport system ATP-binding protein
VTHDLATAYQVADRVAVMQNGVVVEEGDAEAVIRRPQHPYTRALVDAIPPADPTIRWGLEDEAA